MLVTVPARIPCARHERILPARLPLSYDRSHMVTWRVGQFHEHVPLGALDPAAAELLQHLLRPGLILRGRAHDGDVIDLRVPLFPADEAPELTVGAWANARVAEWRAGSRSVAPLAALIVRWAWSGHVEIPLTDPR